MTLIEACEQKKKGLLKKTWEELNDEFGKPYKNGESLRTTFRDGKVSDVETEVKEPTAEELIKCEREKQEIQLAKKETKETIKQAGQVDRICETILSACKVVKPYQPKTIVLPKSSRSQNTIPVLMLSDIQAGTFISSEATNGLNEYSKFTLRQQFKDLTTGLVSIVTKQIDSPRLLKIHMLGDMVEGLGVFPGQAYHVDQDLYEQFFNLAELITTFLQEMLQLFKTIEIKCVPGNHGRVGKRGENPHYINWDLFLYKYIAEKMQNFENIEWDITKSWWLLDKTFNTTSLLLHGDGIRGWNGIPFYGIQRADARYTKLLASMEGRYDIMELGHFHTPAEIPTPTGPIMVNGCFPGASVYALKDLNTSNRPEQRIFGIHEHHGKTWTFPIYLDY